MPGRPAHRGSWGANPPPQSIGSKTVSRAPPAGERSGRLSWLSRNASEAEDASSTLVNPRSPSVRTSKKRTKSSSSTTSACMTDPFWTGTRYCREPPHDPLQPPMWGDAPLLRPRQGGRVSPSKRNKDHPHATVRAWNMSLVVLELSSCSLRTSWFRPGECLPDRSPFRG